MMQRKVVWGGAVLGLLLGGAAMYVLGWNSLAVVAGHSVEFNLARLSPEGESVGYAIPASGSSVPTALSAQCNPDGSATFSWSATGASSYDYFLDNKTRGGWEFASQPCSASPINGDYCQENVQTTSLTVGSGSVTPQEYAFSFKYSIQYNESWGGAEINGGTVIRSFLNLLRENKVSQTALLNSYVGGSKTIICPPSPIIPTCSIAADDCTITTVGGSCDANIQWTASNAQDNQVKVTLVWPNGYQDLWSRYSWPPFGYAPAYYNGSIGGIQTPGVYTAVMHDKSNYQCATDTFTVTLSAASCPSNVPYTETNYASIKNYCDVNNDPDNNDTPPVGMTYPASMACNAAPGWQPYGPTCTAPSCDCNYVPVPPTPLPNLQSVPTNLKAVKGVQLLASTTFNVGEAITFIASTWNVGAADVVVPYFDRFEYRLVGASSWSGINPNLSGVVPLGIWPGGVNGGAYNELATTSFATAGTYEVRHCTDVTNTVTESSEADNCSSGSDIVTVTIIPSDPGGTSNIQGYRVNEAMAPAFAGVMITTGSRSTSGVNPYQILGLAAGPRTVTSGEPIGFTAQYCVHSATNDCGLVSSYTNGKSVSVTLADGETKNIWWRYIPNNFAVNLEVALIGTSAWGTSLTTTDAQRHVKLRWDSPDADTCEEVGTTFDTGVTRPNSGATPDTTGGVTEEPKTPENSGGTKTYRIRCTKDGFDRYDSVTVTDAAALPPTVDLKAKAGLVRSRQTAQLGWTTTNAVSCTLSGGGLTYVTTTDLNRSEITNPYVTDPLTAAQIFTLTCVNSIGLTGSDSIRVEVTGTSQEI